ncbi:unnamed protein product [Angiostrongylus costaricensis]|uniref:Teneurin N-terminal domain-containing protein n=1 Tax=Angiostrongylus costaricensis TaxID=334426 RepID=A0A0R3PQ64_ANGCS|nr:unnamed protein product [Angiostrongylus costaricensis]
MSKPTISPGPCSGNGYVKYHMRPTGIPRALATESEVFTLDDHDDEHRLNGSTYQREVMERNRLFECPLDSDEEKKTDGDVANNIRQHHSGSVRERSRLTDSFDMEDSLSDDLDLLPPLPGAPSTNQSWMNKFHVLNCCNPRIPSKCSIM